MAKLKLLIVDSNREYCLMLERCFAATDAFDVLPSAHTGEEAIRKIRGGEIDVLLLSLVIPQMDGLEILQQIRNMDFINPPKVFMHSAISIESVQRMTQSLGSMYYFQKPVEPSVMAKRILDFLELSNAGQNESASRPGQNRKEQTRLLEEIITHMILKLNIPASIKGYHYIRKSIQLYIENRNKANYGMTTHIYPAVAKLFDSTPSRVERAIRHAISVAWNRSSVDVLNEMFGYTVNKDKGMSTNSEFIAMLADRALIRLKSRNIFNGTLPAVTGKE
ncbi:MAG: Stage 0 sporulation protein A [Firmicutes bacterium ADurb.Bin182]|nr:MAG: Stage 0 sporulation protein A [Firmicutes bacterium ADurb.Bin182]